MSEHAILRAADAPDYTGSAPGAFLGYARPMGATQLAVNLRVLAPHSANVPPGEDPSWGHSHVTIEELYFVVDGEVRIKLGDEVAALGPRDAVLIPPAVPRLVRNDSEREAAILMISRKVQDQAAELRAYEGFWAP